MKTQILDEIDTRCPGLRCSCRVRQQQISIRLCTYVDNTHLQSQWVFRHTVLQQVLGTACIQGGQKDRRLMFSGQQVYFLFLDSASRVESHGEGENSQSLTGGIYFIPVVDSGIGFVIPARQATQAGGPVRQPYAEVDYIPQVRDKEFCLCSCSSLSIKQSK